MDMGRAGMRVARDKEGTFVTEEGERLFLLTKKVKGENPPPAIYASFVDQGSDEAHMEAGFTFGVNFHVAYRIDEDTLHLKKCFVNSRDPYVDLIKATSCIADAQSRDRAKGALKSLFEVDSGATEFMCCPNCGNTDDFVGTARIYETWVVDKFSEYQDCCDSETDESPQYYMCNDRSCPHDMIAVSVYLFEES
jgi:hypothetical protein